MLNSIRLFLMILSLCWLLSACASTWSQASRELLPQSQTYALIGVNLIPVDQPGVLHDQTLIVAQGRIQYFGPRAQTPIPSGAQRLELAGKYVMPGLTDMHVHLADERDLLLLLRHGVTRVRNMAAYPGWSSLFGFADALALRRRIQAGELPGPEIFACGPILEGEPAQNSLVKVIHNPAEAEAAVRETARDGYDCVKVYNHLAAENFAAVEKTARELGLPVMGHVPYEVGLKGALASEMVTIEHLNPYIDNFASTYRFAETELDQQAQLTQQAGIYNCPTLVVWDWHPPYDQAEIEKMTQSPHYRYLPEHLRLFWRLSIPSLYELTFDDKAAYPAHQLVLSLPMVKKLYQQGAPLLIGTDANLTGVYPGSSTLREMELFAQAGLPPATIIRAATLTAAEALKQEADSGSLTVGKKAELLVLDANPLEEIQNIHRFYGVLSQSRWMPLKQLEALLEQAFP